MWTCSNRILLCRAAAVALTMAMTYCGEDHDSDDTLDFINDDTAHSSVSDLDYNTPSTDEKGAVLFATITLAILG